MRFHAGQDFMLDTDGVIGIFDLDTATGAGTKPKITDEFLRRADLVDLSGSMPKSFVLSDTPVEAVYLTQVSTRVLRARAEDAARGLAYE